MKELPITKFALGSPDYAIDFQDSDSIGRDKSTRNRVLLVCDFPAMKTVGLSEKPALILGHDFLHADYDCDINNDDSNGSDLTASGAKVGIDGLRRKNLVFDPMRNDLYLGT